MPPIPIPIRIGLSKIAFCSGVMDWYHAIASAGVRESLPRTAPVAPGTPVVRNGVYQ